MTSGTDRETAQRLLTEAREGEKLAQKALSPYYGAWLLIWGAVYALGYGLIALRAPFADLALAGLSLLGFLLSFALGARAAHVFRTATGRNLALLWSGFGIIAAALILASSRMSEAFFSLAINELVALALWQSGVFTDSKRLRLAAAAFAWLNAGFFAYAPALYAPALAFFGLALLTLGLWQVKRGL